MLTGEDKAPVAELIADGDQIQMADKSFRRELPSWVHHNRSDHVDGMRGYGFNFGDLASHLGPHIIRSFDVGKGQAAKDRELAIHSPALIVLETKTDTPTDWVDAGCALDRILLKLTADGFAASFLNQPIEVPQLRKELAETFAQRGTHSSCCGLEYRRNTSPTHQESQPTTRWSNDPARTERGTSLDRVHTASRKRAESTLRHKRW